MPNAPKSVATLDPSFERQLSQLEQYFQRWTEEATANLVKTHKQIGQRHKAEAQKRVPVEDGQLRNRILTETMVEGDTVTTRTGTNVKYGPYVELGTKHIAGGAVKALGPGANITDAQAIKVWPAKNSEAKKGRKHRIDPTTGVAHPTAVQELERRMAGGVGEQMPWLRPAWQAIRNWALNKINQAVTPPPK